MNTSRRSHTMTIENWNQIFTWTTVILAVVVAFAGIGAKITGNIINQRKNAEIETLKPWRLSDEQQAKLRDELRSFSAGKIAFAHRLMDAEGRILPTSLQRYLNQPGGQLPA